LFNEFLLDRDADGFAKLVGLVTIAFPRLSLGTIPPLRPGTNNSGPFSPTM
jgi:hypothetical protein